MEPCSLHKSDAEEHDKTYQFLLFEVLNNIS